VVYNGLAHFKTPQEVSWAPKGHLAGLAGDRPVQFFESGRKARRLPLIAMSGRSPERGPPLNFSQPSVTERSGRCRILYWPDLRRQRRESDRIDHLLNCQRDYVCR